MAFGLDFPLVISYLSVEELLYIQNKSSACYRILIFVIAIYVSFHMKDEEIEELDVITYFAQYHSPSKLHCKLTFFLILLSTKY